MMLASATPLEIMAGSVVGAVAVALTASLVWLGYGLAGIAASGALGPAPLHLIPWFVAYLTCALLLLSAVGAAIGAAASSPSAAQRFSTFLTVPLVAPLFVLPSLLDHPNAAWAVAFSFVPPVSPMVMMARQASPGGVPFWQPWLALLAMLIAAAAVTWVASRVFRVGLLAQGETRWVDMARWAWRG
jgi:ABC-2 type transport system permease protein